jgi:hypothetical protein
MFVSVVLLLYWNREFRCFDWNEKTEDEPKQFDREHILVFFRKFWVLSVCFETILFVSVVSIQVRTTETNRNKQKNVVFGFKKQTETQPKQILFRFVSVQTEFFLVCFEDRKPFWRPSSPSSHIWVRLSINFKHYSWNSSVSGYWHYWQFMTATLKFHRNTARAVFI